MTKTFSDVKAKHISIIDSLKTKSNALIDREEYNKKIRNYFESVITTSLGRFRVTTGFDAYLIEIDEERNGEYRTIGVVGKWI